MKKLTIAEGKAKWPGMEVADVYSHVTGYNQAIDEMNQSVINLHDLDALITVISAMQKEIDSQNKRITELEHKHDGMEVHTFEKTEVIETSNPFRCPVCNGTGNVPGGFYQSTMGITVSSDITEPCRACKGTGIIWEGKS